jgi:ribosome-associated toxin RatA of RatAB toxin-antitoxin module
MNIYRSALINYSCEQMFALVHDVKAYPEFLPEIQSVDILADDNAHISARLHVKKGPVVQSFSTSNDFDKPNRMLMNLNNGPFKYLKGEWTFTQLAEDACKVEFKLDFEVSNRILSFALTPIIKQLADQMVQRFCTRAKAVYC